MPKEERGRVKKKKEWATPQLIILTRGKNGAERVLETCKAFKPIDDPGSGGDRWADCILLFPGIVSFHCKLRSAS